MWFIFKKYEVADRVKNIEYAIRDVVVKAKEIEAKGTKINYLNIGDPVKYGFDTPDYIKEALNTACKQGNNWYSSSEGIPELREAIALKEKKINKVDISSDDVLVTSGVSEAIMFLMASIINPGDEILIPGPSYPPYISYIKFFGGKPETYKMVNANQWQPDLDDIKYKINKNTKAIVIINPNNPTGTLYSNEVLRGIIDIATEYDIPIISDEIYDRIVYDEEFTSTASLAGDIPIIGLNGFSKTYLMSGWRLGYIYFSSQDKMMKELKENILKLARVRLSPNTPSQFAAKVALEGDDHHINEMIKKLKMRRDYIVKRFNEIDGIETNTPKGAFYIFPKVRDIGKRWKTDKDFVYKLLSETGVLFVHGSGFGEEYGQGYFRSIFLPSEEILQKACDMLEKFMRIRS